MSISHRFFITIFLLLGAISSFSYATDTSNNIITDNKRNASMVNTLGATDIVDLSAHFTNSTYIISNFIIKSLPNANLGILYMSDGITVVTVGQKLTRVESDGLKFDPITSCTASDALFTYAGVSDEGVEGTVATVTIPLTVGAGCSITVTADDKNNPQMSNRLDAVNILDLSGKDSDGNAVNSFIITSLPSENQGVLYMSDGTTPVHVNQTLTLEEANGLRFDPNANFVGDVTFTYVALGDNGVRSNEATVTIPLINSVTNAPTADDKVNPAMLNTLGAVNILDLSGKDSNGDAITSFIITSLPSSNQGILYMADGKTVVSLNQILTLEEANGLKFDPDINFVGDVKFTYMAIDANGVKSSNATVTIPVVVSHNTDIVIHNDVGVANGDSNPVVIDVLANDIGTSLEGGTVLLVNSDGTYTNEIVVDGEGTWSVNSDNTIVFTPVTPFVGTPTPVNYVVRGINGAVSNTATITIKGQCICKPYTEDIPVFSSLGLFLMMFFSIILGLIFLKKEENMTY
ncbi:Putative hemagglutinin/hemolysin-related protein [hydrothermal vent metagenome]|uniref:Putative hemagglutinin/hemolysin-related protein n=1 Tax=hydrothermal vent metagenome TaxID=652676 RepID=A0A1W1CU02_9ZZZZ